MANTLQLENQWYPMIIGSPVAGAAKAPPPEAGWLWLIDIWKTDPLWARRCHKQCESYLSRGTPLQKYLWRATRILCPEKLMILRFLRLVLAPQRQRCHPWKHMKTSYLIGQGSRAVISHESLSSGIIPVSSPRCGYPSSDPLQVIFLLPKES